MSIVVKKNQAWAVTAETTEGTYRPPQSSADFVQCLDNGTALNRAKSTLTRNIFTSSIGETTPRTGEFTVTGTLPTEARAHSMEGHAPEYDVLMTSAMGNKRQSSSVITTKATGNTGAILQIQDADISTFALNDIIMVKEAGAFLVSPISAISTTTGAASITLLVPRATGNFPASVTIAKYTTYTPADSGHPAFSVSRYFESAVLQQATGCRVKTLALESFDTGKLPGWKFEFEGLNFDSSLTAPPYSPSYDTQVPPIVLDGRVFMDGQAITINSLTMSLANTLGFQSSISAPNGRISGRATARAITGTFDPYMASDTIANFTKFKNNTSFSIFAYAKVPTAVTGEFGGVVAVYLPQCLITTLGEGDDNGLVKDTITYSANRGLTGTLPEIFIGFI
jgi:hypothetical protein